MLGAVINGCAIVLASLVGLLFKRGIRENIQDALEKAMGVAVFLVGLSGALQNIFSIDENGVLQTNGGLILVLSLAIGTLLGEMLDIDGKMNRFGAYIEQKLHFEQFSKGFVGASLLFCTGAMAIIGPITEVLTGDMSVQLVKSGMDATIAIIMASTMGVGVAFSGPVVFLYQGAFALLGLCIGNAIDPQLLGQICMVGYAIVMCIGINFLKMTKIKTANMIPAVILPVFVYLLSMLKTL